METALTDKQDMFPAPEASQDGMLQDQSQKRKSFDPEVTSISCYTQRQERISMADTLIDLHV